MPARFVRSVDGAGISRASASSRSLFELEQRHIRPRVLAISYLLFVLRANWSEFLLESLCFESIQFGSRGGELLAETCRLRMDDGLMLQYHSGCHMAA